MAASSNPTNTPTYEQLEEAVNLIKEEIISKYFYIKFNLTFANVIFFFRKSGFS